MFLLRTWGPFLTMTASRQRDGALGSSRSLTHSRVSPFLCPTPAVDIGWESVEQLAQRILDPKASNHEYQHVQHGHIAFDQRLWDARCRQC